MQVILKGESERLVRGWLEAGRYATAEDAVLAAISTLEDQFRFDDFAPGELNALIAEADAEIERGEVVDGPTFFAELLRRDAADIDQP